MQAPDRKVTVGAGMAFFSTIAAWAIGEFAGIDVPPEIAVAAAGFLTFVTQYFVPNP